MLDSSPWTHLMPVTGEIIISFVRSVAVVISLSLSFFGCGYDVVSLMTFHEMLKRFKSLEGVFALIHFFLWLSLCGCGKQKVLSSHLFIANDKEKCCVRHTFWKMSSSATLHVLADFPFLNKSRFDHSSCFFQAWFWDRFDIVCF